MSLKNQKEYKQSLINILKSHNYQVHCGKGSFKQGSCLVMNEKKIVLNSILHVDLQIKFLADVLIKENLQIPKEVQQFLDKMKYDDHVKSLV